MALSAKVLLLEGESANEIQEGALSGLSQIAGGAVFRGPPRLCAPLSTGKYAHLKCGAISKWPMWGLYIYL